MSRSINHRNPDECDKIGFNHNFRDERKITRNSRRAEEEIEEAFGLELRELNSKELLLAGLKGLSSKELINRKKEKEKDLNDIMEQANRLREEIGAIKGIMSKAIRDRNDNISDTKMVKIEEIKGILSQHKGSLVTVYYTHMGESGKQANCMINDRGEIVPGEEAFVQSLETNVSPKRPLQRIVFSPRTMTSIIIDTVEYRIEGTEVKGEALKDSAPYTPQPQLKEGWNMPGNKERILTIFEAIKDIITIDHNRKKEFLGAIIGPELTATDLTPYNDIIRAIASQDSELKEMIDDIDRESRAIIFMSYIGRGKPNEAIISGQIHQKNRIQGCKEALKDIVRILQPKLTELNITKVKHFIDNDLQALVGNIPFVDFEEIFRELLQESSLSFDLSNKLEKDLKEKREYIKIIGSNDQSNSMNEVYEATLATLYEILQIESDNP